MTEITRRKFIQLTVIGSAAAAAGCENVSRYAPGVYGSEWRGQYGGYDDRIQPYVNQPAGMQDGIPQYFATTCRMCGAGCGIYVRTMNGRAIKVEGNPAHPVSAGKTCARGQASLQHLYNPDRLRRPKERSTRTAALVENRDWNSVLTRTAQALKAARGRCVIIADAMEMRTSPSTAASVDAFAKAIGAEVVAYQLLDDAPWRTASTAVYGRNQIPYYALDQADCIVSFGGNFLEAWPSPVLYNRLFGDFRQGARRRQGEHGRFYYIGPRMSMTAAKADRWIPCDAGREAAVATAVMTALGNPSMAHAAGGVDAATIGRIASAFAAAGTRAVAVGGDGLLGYVDATAQFTAVERLNQQVKSQCVGFGNPSPAPPSSDGARAGFAALTSAMQSMSASQVGAVVLIGQSNPAFTLPRSVDLGAAFAHVPFIVALTPFEDETTGYADVVLPTRSFLEAWGDSVPHVVPAGMTVGSLQQPVVDPAYIAGNGIDTTTLPEPWMDTRPLTDLLADLAHRSTGTPLSGGQGPGERSIGEDAVRKSWSPASNADWTGALSTGGQWNTHNVGLSPMSMSSRTTPNNSSPIIGEGSLSDQGRQANTFALQLYPHIYWTDGRHANLPWLQEIPDPMTSAVWNSWVEINVDTAHRLGIRTGDIVRLTSAQGSIEVPAIPYPAIHPEVVAMPIGQGHAGGHYGRYANGCGANPLAIVDPVAEASTGSLAFGSTRVSIEKVRDARPLDLVLLQDIPGGQEPDAVKDLIHTTAREWRQTRPGSPQRGATSKPGGAVI